MSHPRTGERGTSGGPTRSSGKGGSLLTIIAIAVLLLGGGGFGLSSLLGGTGGDTSSIMSQHGYQSSYAQTQQQFSGPGPGFDHSSLLGAGVGNISNGWAATANTGKLNTSVSSAARDKRTKIIGGGRDTVTIMVYMCGTDLESKNGMGTYDLQEMTAATLSDNVNLLLYTGGCKR